jgi:hypothetical protein
VTLAARLARTDDLDAAVDTISVAFHRDPVWSWAFPDDERRPGQFHRWWPLFVGGALEQGFTWMTAGAETVAVWIRPNAPELTPEAEAQVWPTLVELLGESRARRGRRGDRTPSYGANRGSWVGGSRSSIVRSSATR